jgi:hypothetical protein
MWETNGVLQRAGKHALRNGFVSGRILVATPCKRSFVRATVSGAQKMAEEIRRHMPQTLRFAARRPAGTREALPGSASQGLSPMKILQLL